jgi:hypothetical protein
VGKFLFQNIDEVVLVPVCYMSVGHIARVFEEAKIATVVISIKAFETRMAMMSLPRVQLTPELMGRLIDPFDDREKEAIIQAILMFFESEDKNKTIQHYKN